MNKLNNMWSSSQQASLMNQAQLLLLHQQQQQHNFMANQQPIQHKNPTSSFTSNFSVNSLLNQGIPENSNNQQHIANAVLTRHIAQAVANLNMQQFQMQQRQQQQQQQNQLNEYTFKAPANKKQKFNDSTQEYTDSIQNSNQLNSSTCSISSPSSSSSSAFSSSSVSFDHTFNQEHNHSTHNLDYFKNHHMEINGSSASVSFNESNEFADEQQNESERSSPISLLTDSTKPRRSNRKRIAVDLQNPCCPICGLSLRLVDLQAHLANELERLEKVNSFCGAIASIIKAETKENEPNTSNKARKRTSSGCEKIKPTTNQNETKNSRQLAYLKIKEKRQSRIKNKLRMRMKENESNQTHLCPLCNESISDSKDQINIHLESCPMLKNDEYDGDTSESSQGPYETYEWAGQKRVRAISMLQNPAQGIDATSVKKEEYEGELNVDFDDTDIAFGKPQFNESDLIPIESDGKKQNLLRQAVIDKENDENKEETEVINNEGTSSSKRKHESDNRETSRCLICMESYSNALISVNCWHVHCKPCWMQSLGAKKLCPQCKVITSPKDLRRIFL